MDFVVWGIKGSTEPIRYLLEHLNLEYNEFNPFTLEEANNIKNYQKKHGLDFVDFPILLDGKNKVSEKTAVAMYISSKVPQKNLFGKNPFDKIQHKILESFLNEFNDNYLRLLKLEEKDILKNYNDKEQNFLKKYCYLSKYLNNKEFFLSYLTYSDFLFLHNVKLNEILTKVLRKRTLFKDFENLKNHKINMENLDGLKNYLNEDLRAERFYLFSESNF